MPPILDYASLQVNYLNRKQQIATISVDGDFVRCLLKSMTISSTFEHMGVLLDAWNVEIVQVLVVIIV